MHRDEKQREDMGKLQSYCQVGRLQPQSRDATANTHSSTILADQALRFAGSLLAYVVGGVALQYTSAATMFLSTTGMSVLGRSLPPIIFPAS